MSVTGRIHSIETCGTVDGPGIRFVVFMQGCPLRCRYCHNPDTWKMSDGTLYTPQAIFEELTKYSSYMKFSKGGVTITGGEPLLQPDFLIELFTLCKAAGIHTAIDTSGYVFNDKVKEVLKLTDLVLLDIKNYDPAVYRDLTGVELQPTLDFLSYLDAEGIRTWVRYVLVPGLTDNIPAIEALAELLGQSAYVEKIEILPFHKMGEYKWQELGEVYSLKDTPEPDEDLKNRVVGIFSAKHPNVVTA